MPTLRLAAGLLATAALAVPATADAATYQPITFSSPAGNVMSSGGKTYAEPALDIVKVHGERYARTFSVVVTYQDLAPLSYTRHLMYLADSADGEREKVVELRAAADGRATTTSVYYVKPPTTGVGATITKVRCAGARAVPSYTKDTITYTLPVSCYGLSADSAVLAASSGKWTKSGWKPGNLTAVERPSLSDSDDHGWAWSGTAASTALRSGSHGALRLF